MGFRKWKGLLLIGVSLLCCCKTEKRLEIHDVDLNIHVEDDQGKVLDGIKTYLFSNYDNYLTSVNKHKALGYDTSAVINNGTLFYENLSSDLNYWIFISYRDSTRFLDMKNYIYSNSLYNKLPPGSSTKAYIKVVPSNGIFSFWSTDANAGNLDLTLFFKDTLGGEINSTRNIIPSSPHDNNALTFNRDPGRYKWYVKGANGCLWIGDTLLQAGQHIKIELGSCDNGNISFWTASYNNSLLPIKIVLNVSDTIGTLTASQSSAPANCLVSANTIQASRPQGDYTYSAFSKNGTCIWTGQFRLNKQDCKIIQLDDCN